MGVVYRAFDPGLQREVALKVMLGDEFWAADDDIDRFLREARAAAKLHHPQIVPVFDVGLVDGKHYFTMELIDGESLAQRIQRLGPLPARDAASMLAPIARAVHYAHTEGVIHRDIKPSNILLSARRAPLLTDFGLAKETRSGSDLTRSGALLGTPAYMAPEQAEGKKSEVDERTDVYALGAVLYEMLTGRAPFIAEDALDVVQLVRTEEPPSIQRLVPSVPADLVTITAKAMEKTRMRRYASARHLADDLGRFLKGDPIQARPMSRAELLLRRARRYRAILIPVGAGLVLAAGFGVWGMVNAHRRAASEAEREKTQAQATDLATQKQAEDEAGKLLETGRTALEQAIAYQYNKAAVYDELVKRVQAGQRKIEEAIQRAPEMAAGHYLLGRAWDLQGWDDKAEVCWRKSIARDAGFCPAHYELGRLLVVRAFLTTLGHTPEERRMSVPVAQAYAEEAAHEFDAAAKGNGLEDPATRDLAAAMIAHLQGKKEDVLRIARAQIEKMGRVPGAEEFLWLAGLESTGEEALRQYDAAISIRPKYPMALNCRGFTRQGKGDYDEAIADYSEALKINPRFSIAFVNRAYARLEKRDVDGAISDYDEALKINPRYTPALERRGYARSWKGDYDGAISDYEAALKIDPRYALAIHNRGVARAFKRDFDGAISDYTEALAIDPRYALAYCNRGVAREAKSDFDGAISDYTEAVRIDPRKAEAYCDRGNLRLARHDLDAAIADSEEALKTKPTYADALYLRGRVHKAKGDPAGMAADYAKALEVASKDWRHRKQVEEELKKLNLPGGK